MFGGLEEEWMNTAVSTGTTTLAFKFSDGVMIAADSRTSVGNYVANRFTDKITKITDYVCCCRSGASADTQAIADLVSYNINLYENQQEKAATVQKVASEFRKLCYTNRDQLSASMIVAGYDQTENTGKVYSITNSGMIFEEDVTFDGSGSRYVLGYIDTNYSLNMDLTKAISFACSVIGHAMTFDGHSGGVIRLGTITKQGIRRYILQQTLDKKDGQLVQPNIQMLY